MVLLLGFPVESSPTHPSICLVVVRALQNLLCEDLGELRISELELAQVLGTAVYFIVARLVHESLPVGDLVGEGPQHQVEVMLGGFPRKGTDLVRVKDLSHKVNEVVVHVLPLTSILHGTQSVCIEGVTFYRGSRVG